VPEMAEDLTHEVFLKIWEVRHQLHIERSFKSYLFRVSHNKAIDMHRKIAADNRLMDQLAQHYNAGALEEDLFSQEDLQRFNALFEEALASLSPRRRRIYEMSKKEKKSYEQIGLELNISRNTVKGHISQTLALLKEFILEKGQFALVLFIIKKML
jgi:RNA polymerase sigma factor (sigma-70 family)